MRNSARGIDSDIAWIWAVQPAPRDQRVNIDGLPILLSALASGLLSLVISHVYYRVSVRRADSHHTAQMESAEERHAQQVSRMEKQMAQMERHHAEQVLVLRTALLAIEKDTGVQAARDPQGNLTGGVHHEGTYTALPDVSPHVIEDVVETATAGRPEGAERNDDARSRLEPTRDDGGGPERSGEESAAGAGARRGASEANRARARPAGERSRR